jgi:hypothetical protein
VIWTAAVTLTLLTAACGSDDDGTTAPGPNPEPSSTTAIQVLNGSSIAAWYVYFKACGTEDWGDDRLGSSNVLSPNESFTSAVDAGCYDVLATTDPTEPPAYEARYDGQAVTAGAVTGLTISGGDWHQVQSAIAPRQVR